MWAGRQFVIGSAPLAVARTTGLPTRSRIRVLGVPDTDPAAWLTTVTFYDDRARPVRVQATIVRAGKDLVVRGEEQDACRRESGRVRSLRAGCLPIARPGA